MPVTPHLDPLPGAEVRVQQSLVGEQSCSRVAFLAWNLDQGVHRWEEVRAQASRQRKVNPARAERG